MPIIATEHYGNITHHIQNNLTASGQVNRHRFGTVHKPLMKLDHRFGNKGVGCTTINHYQSTMGLYKWSITTGTTFQM